MITELTQEILKELIHYNPDTGIFTWKPRSIKWFSSVRMMNSWNSRCSNKKCGSIIKPDGKNYLRINFYQQSFYAHRLAFLYMTGKFPEDQVDHEDGDGLNNKWSNLRSVDNQENSKNHRKQSNNSSGYVGVGLYSNGKYTASIYVDKKKKHLGYFHSLDSAIKVRKEAELKYNYHKNHGTERPL